MEHEEYALSTGEIEMEDEKKVIMFVCHGNIFRSVLAERCCRLVIERLGRAKEFEVISRGLQGMPGVPAPKHLHIQEYVEQWAIAEPHVRALGIDFDGHCSTPVSDEDVKGAQIIVAMDSLVLSGFDYCLTNKFPNERGRMRLFSQLHGSDKDVDDPHGVMDSDVYRQMVNYVFETLNRHADVLFSWLTD